MPPASPSLAELSGPDAAETLARLRATGPVAFVPAVDGWLVTGHAAAVAVMRDDAGFTVDDPRFSTARVVGPSMLSLDGAAHRRHRSAFAAPFRPSRVERRFGAEIDALCAELLARCDGGVVDLHAALAGPLSVAIIASALGLPPADADTVLGWYGDIVGAVTALSAGADPGPGAALAMQALAAHVRAAGDRSILRAADLATDDVVANAAVMMFGGIETTEGMIANALAHVLADPDVAARAGADPAVLAAAVEESLRLEPAAAAVDRYATADLALGAVRIRRGDLVRVSLLGANRDPAVFPDPDRFDPDRANRREQVAFARGPHTCIAMDLARLETRRAVDAVVRLPAPRLVEVEPATGLIFRKVGAVRVAFG